MNSAMPMQDKYIPADIERIGDHATNIGEYVIYMVKGFNVRHASTAEIEARMASDEG